MLPSYFNIFTAGNKKVLPHIHAIAHRVCIVPLNPTLARLNAWLVSSLQGLRIVLAPSTLPAPFHNRIALFSKFDVEQRIYEIYHMAKELVDHHEAQKAAELTDYLTTTQFARLVNRSPKTISNKASAGFFGQAAKQENGTWLIHKSMVQNYE